MTARQTGTQTGKTQPTEEQLVFADAEEILAKIKVAVELKKLNLGENTNQEVTKLLRQLTDTASALSREKSERFKIPSLYNINDLLFVSSIDYDGATILVAEFGVATKVVPSVIDRSKASRNPIPAQVSNLNDLIRPELIRWNNWVEGRDTVPASFRGIIFPKTAEITPETNHEVVEQNLHLLKGLGMIATADALGGEPRTDISAYCRAFFIGKETKANNKYIDSLRVSLKKNGGYSLEQDTEDITESFARNNSQIEIFSHFPKLRIFQFTAVREQH